MNYAQRQDFHASERKANPGWKASMNAISLILGFVTAMSVAYFAIHWAVKHLW